MAIATYKKLESLSNFFYNDGLEKAGVRDLTGAIESLQQSLRMNKNNIDARNLLGLVYYEMGEVVAALSEWVISKNLETGENLADYFMDTVRNSPAKLDEINQTIKKFNIAYNYCRQDSLDLAVIQLKKVLSLNSGFIKAHLLLALLYLKAGNFDRAKVEAQKVLKLDTGNLMARRYLKEADNMLLPGDGGKLVSDAASSGNNETIRYNSGNEMIIQPRKQSVLTKSGSIWGIVLGIVLGIAVSCFLILPQRIKNITNNNNRTITGISEVSDSKSAQIGEYEQQIAKLNKQLKDLNERVGENQDAASTCLMKAVKIYMEDPTNIDGIALALEKVNVDENEKDLSAEFKDLYGALMQKVGSRLADIYYDEGKEAYKKKDYTVAIEKFAKAYQYYKDDENIIYYLANSYYDNGDIEKAKEKYDLIISNFPKSKCAMSSKTKLAEINNSSAGKSSTSDNSDNTGN